MTFLTARSPYHVVRLCFRKIKKETVFRKWNFCLCSGPAKCWHWKYSSIQLLISDVEFELGVEFGPIHPKIPERPEVEDIVLTTGWPPSWAGVTMFCYFIHHGEKWKTRTFCSKACDGLSSWGERAPAHDLRQPVSQRNHNRMKRFS